MSSIQSILMNRNSYNCIIYKNGPSIMNTRYDITSTYFIFLYNQFTKKCLIKKRDRILCLPTYSNK